MWHIAFKNIKTMSKNVLFLFFLIQSPLFMIFLIKMMEDNIEKTGGAAESLVEMVVLTQAHNGYLTQAFASGLLAQFLLIAGVIAAAMVVTEREQNTLMRIVATPITKTKILVGIFISHCVIVLAICILIIGLSYFLFDIYWGEWLLVIVVTLFSVYVAAALAFVISGVFKNPKVTGGVMSAVIIAMTFMSGSFVQGPQFDVLSKFTINKWISDAYVRLMEGNGLESIGSNLLILGIMGTVLMLIASILYRKETIYE